MKWDEREWINLRWGLFLDEQGSFSNPAIVVVIPEKLVTGDGEFCVPYLIFASRFRDCNDIWYQFVIRTELDNKFEVDVVGASRLLKQSVCEASIIVSCDLES